MGFGWDLGGRGMEAGMVAGCPTYRPFGSKSLYGKDI